MHRGHSRRTAGVAALLPALFLASLYVAAPFAGTTTHAIAHQTVIHQQHPGMRQSAHTAAAARSIAASAQRDTAASPAANTAANTAAGSAASDAGSAANAASAPVHFTFAGKALHTMVVCYVAAIALAVAVLAAVALRFAGAERHDRH